jgi:hypothetical protein
MGRRELLNKFSRSMAIRLHESKVKYLVHMEPDVLRPSILDEILVWKMPREIRVLTRQYSKLHTFLFISSHINNSRRFNNCNQRQP